jgi:riboflavin kinase/FMN adenylyltransferase
MLLRDLCSVPMSPTVVAIGAFDGVHRGHLALLAAARQSATARGLTTAALTFEPLPRHFFRREATLRLTPMATRYRLLRAAGAEQVLMPRFDARFAAMSPRDFVERALVRRLSAREVVVGQNFRFGHRREGDLRMLAEYGAEFGFALTVVEPVLGEDGEAISASAVRAALVRSDFERAALLLGRRFSYAGRVVRGQALGRQLGFPTANIRWPQDSLGFSGIFAVRVSGAGLTGYPGVASLGYRPAVGGKELLLEVHLLDFAGDLYGQRLDVEFVAKQRDEWHFASLDALVEQIRRDADEARQRLR